MRRAAAAKASTASGSAFAHAVEPPAHSSADSAPAERFAERFPGYAKAPGFEIVIAYLGGEPVGQAFGYTLPPAARWWDGLTTPVPDGFTEETGSRTFALNELMVVPDWQGKGVAHALHDALLGGRAEERATLLVREDNTSAQRAYARWGWRKIGKSQPFPDSPHFDAMILDLTPGDDRESAAGGTPQVR